MKIKGQKKNAPTGRIGGARPGAGRKKAAAGFAEVDVRMMDVLSLIAARAAVGVSAALTEGGCNPRDALITATKDVGEIYTQNASAILDGLKKGGAK